VILVYRKRKDAFDWHFHTQCPEWPESDFVQVLFIESCAGERLCEVCAKLEQEMFHRHAE
jgi:hypothetical protein